MIGRIRLIAGWFAVATALFVASPVSVRAANNEMGDVLVDGFYGGLIGALVGAGVLALTDDPGDHLQYMVTGAGIGVIAGTVYGLSQVGRQAMIDVDRGHVAWHVPAIAPTVTANAGETPALSVSTALLRVRF
jgi:hypothetical protein